MDSSAPVSPRLERQIGFLVEADRLKEILRRTVLTRSRRRENDAEHSWHLCLCVLVLAEHAAVPDLDVLRALKMVILHDLVEIDAGDTFAYDTAALAGQHEREARAAERIFGLLPEDQARAFRALWDEFEARETPEARFAAAVDRFQPMLLNARTEGHAWREHGVTYDQVLARNQHVAQGAPAVWAYAARMVKEAVEKGHLQRLPGERVEPPSGPPPVRSWLTVIPPAPEEEFQRALQRWREANRELLDGLEPDRLAIDLIRATDERGQPLGLRQLRVDVGGSAPPRVT